MALRGTSTYFYGFTAGQRINREDLLGLIVNISPTDTPFMTQAPKTTVKGVTHEWLQDTLAATSIAGAIEGDDWGSATATTQASRVSNVTQIFRKDIAVSETQRSVNPAAFKDAYAYELQKAIKEIARNVEATIFATQITNAAPADGLASADAVNSRYLTGGTGTGRLFRGIEGFITRGISTTASGGTGQNYMFPSQFIKGTPATVAVSCGTVALGDVNQILQNIYEAGGSPEQIYLSPSLKRQFSAFSTGSTLSANTRNIAAIDAKAVIAIDFIQTDFGLMQLIMDRWVPQATNTASGTQIDARGRVYFIERSKVRVGWLRPIQHTLIGKQGDSVAGIVLGEATLEVLSGDAIGVMRGVNNFA